MEEQKPIISIDHVSMRFNLAKEKHESLKEYFVALLHGGVRFDDLHFGNVGLDKIKLSHEVESPFYINVSIYIAIQLILYSILPLRARWRKNFVAAVTTAAIFRLVG